MFSKKTIILALVGIFVLAGAAFPFVTHADQSGEHHPGMMAQRLADTFGLDKDSVAKYLHQGVNPRDLRHAALLAKASGKPIADVLQMKTLANTWQDVGQSLGVTPEQLRSLRQDMLASRLQTQLAIPKQTTLDLLQKGYHPRDIVVANILAQNTQKPVTDVLAMKQINNKWSDVAKQLGIDEAAFKQDISKIRGAFPQRHFDGDQRGSMGTKFGCSS